jgi:hypothetical protein
MGFFRGPNGIRSGLVVQLDPINARSSSGNSTVINDISVEGVKANATMAAGAVIGPQSIILDETLFQYFTIPQPSATFNPNRWTVELTIKPTAATGYLVSPQSSGFDHFLLFNGSTQNVTFQTTQSTDVNNRGLNSATNSVPFNNWTHITFSLDNMFKRLYINGILIATQDLTIDTSFAANWTGTWWFGERAQIGGNAWSGEMSCIRIYNRVLSDSEVKQNFDSIKGRFPNLIFNN